MTTVVLGRLTDYEVGFARAIPAPGRTLVVVRIGGSLYVLDDRCSHEDYSLAEGEVWADERELECAKHGSTFDLRTGAPCSLPATTAIPVFDVVVEDGDVSVVLP